MNNEQVFCAIGNISDDLISDAEITEGSHKKATMRFRWKPLIAACLVICLLGALVPMWRNQPMNNPLVITAKAVSVEGQPYTAQLSLGDRIQLVETEFIFEGDNKYYTFDLTLVDGMYLQLSAVDDQWNLKLDKGVHYSGEDNVLPYWALTKGNEIAVISTDLDGKVLEAYVNGTAQPRMKGKSMIWRVNEDGMTRCIIDCFDENFSRVASYHLEIVQINDNYYAEIVTIK